MSRLAEVFQLVLPLRQKEATVMSTRKSGLAGVVVLALFCAANYAQAEMLLINTGILGTSGSKAYTGAAVLGSTGDTWNGWYWGADRQTASFTNLLSSSGSNTGATVAFSSPGKCVSTFATTNGTALDSITRDLMKGYANFAPTQTVTMTVSGLTDYAGGAFQLVLYGAGDTSGQGATFALASDNQTAGGTSLATTNGSTRVVLNSDGSVVTDNLGKSYAILTGVVDTAGSVVFTWSKYQSSSTHAAMNGFQLQVEKVPEPSSTVMGLAMLGGCIFAWRKWR